MEYIDTPVLIHNRMFLIAAMTMFTGYGIHALI